jgi:membrane protein DedA with SNARE-associated domain
MWSWINAAVDLVSLYPAGAMAAVFLAAIIEAVAVLGILIPGTPILMAVAGAAAMAGQPMVPLLALSIMGAVIGDFVSFWFGQRFSMRLCGVWPFSRRPALMANAGHFFERYGTYSVALCRFVPVLRSTVPLVAGMAGMCRRRFVLANVASAFVWAPLHIYPAQMAGMSLSRLEDGHWQSAAAWGVILLVCCAMGWAIHRVIMTRVRPSAAGHALRVDIERIQAVAGCHEQPVAEAAAEAQVGAAFGKPNVADC